MNRIWLVSDTHFGHDEHKDKDGVAKGGIIRLCNRPFSSVEEMDKELINNWNFLVEQDDIVYHLGDFTAYHDGRAKGIFNALNGHKHLIIGNHDHKVSLQLYWKTINNYLELNIKGKKIILFHYPIEDWSGRYKGSLHFHGHVHNTPIIEIKNRFNISVEMTNYSPVLLEDYL